MLPVAMARSDDSLINMLCTSGFVDDILLSHNGANGPESKTTLCFVEFARWRHRGEVAVYDCRLVC